MEISNYDKFGYDYSTYWKDREYENIAEHAVLDKVFKTVPSGNWFLDIGGSYGRLADTYSKRFKHPIILDYSLETLIHNKEALQKQYSSIILIAANAYRLPFHDSVFDSILMVRVLHHLNEPEIYFKEVGKILKSNGFYIQEFANKMHLKAKFRALSKGNLKFFSKKPYQQPTIGNFEGTRDQSSIFLNYHPKYIRKLFKGSRLKIYKRYGCSYLRIPLLKKKFKITFLVKMESFLQNILSWSNISPSIFLIGKSTKKISKVKRFNSLYDILVCPKCKNPLSFSKNRAHCVKCGKEYLKNNDIWDFRIDQ